MKTASLVDIKKELKFLSNEELYAMCMRLGRFKAENKALLTYLLYYQNDESGFIEEVKETLRNQLKALNTDSYFYMKKTIRKVLKQIRLFSRLSGQKATEIELLIFFCQELSKIEPSIFKNKVLHNLYSRQLISIRKKILLLHEDLQYDFNLQLNNLPEYGN